MVYGNLFEAKHNKMTEQENKTPDKFQVGTRVIHTPTGDHGEVTNRDLGGPQVLVRFDNDDEKSVSHKELELEIVKSENPSDNPAN